MSVLRGDNPIDHVLPRPIARPAHCATCNCADDQQPPPPATSSEWARRAALEAAETVDDIRRALADHGAERDPQ